MAIPLKPVLAVGLIAVSSVAFLELRERSSKNADDKGSQRTSAKAAPQAKSPRKAAPPARSITSGTVPDASGGAVRTPTHRPVEVAPRVFELDPERVVMAWLTKEPSAGTLELFGPDGARTLTEESESRHHRIEALDLAPGTAYRYLIDGRFPGTFRTPQEEGPMRFAVFGHPGGTMGAFDYPTSMLAATLHDVDPDFLLCTGDACFYTNEASYKELYFDVFREVFAERPIYLTAANHEISFPERRKVDYSFFRTLFPRDFADPRFPFYSFVRGNVEFFAFAYGPMTKAMSKAQYKWLEESLQSSQSEFRVIFLGGANTPSRYDRERLFKVAAENDADLIFGGDGVGYKEETHEGVKFLFAGANGPKQPSFFLVNTNDYELKVAQYQSPMGAKQKQWTFRSRRPKATVLDVMEGLEPVPETRKTRSRAFEQPSTDFHGIKLSLRSGLSHLVSFRIHYEARDDVTGEITIFRTQPRKAKPGELVTSYFALPGLGPLSGNPWTLLRVEAEFIERRLPKEFDITPHLLEFALFEDPLK